MVADAEDVPPITASPIPNCHWLLQFLTAEIYPSSLIQTFLSGDSFGIDNANERVYAAEAVDDVIVMRFRRAPTEQLIDRNPMLARYCATPCCVISLARMAARYCSAA